MSDRGLLGYFYLKSDLSIGKLERMFEEFFTRFPQINISSPVNYSARVVYDPDTYYIKNKFDTIYLNDNISINFRNEEKVSHDFKGDPAIFKGRRQVRLSIEIQTIEDFHEIFMEELETGFRLLPLIYLMGKNLDAFFGLINYIDNMDILDEKLFFLEPEYQQYIEEGPVPGPIREAFKSHDHKLSEGAIIKRTSEKSTTLYIVDGDRIIHPRMWSSLTLPIVDVTKSQTLRNIEYLEELLNLPYWMFYLDKELAEEIGFGNLCRWAVNITHLDDHGYSIQNLIGGDDFTTTNKSKDLYHAKIRPKIIKRLRKEYSQDHLC